MEEMKFYTEEEALDKVIGEKGTPERNRYEDDINNFLIGEAIKQTREAKNLTQEQLGELMGVKRAQISKIESGKSVTFSTIIRAFKAMGVNSANLDLGSLGKVALWQELSKNSIKIIAHSVKEWAYFLQPLTLSG